MSVWIVATLDTKGVEAAFVRDRLTQSGVPVVIVDAGCLGEPAARADVPRDEVYRAAGTTLAQVRERGDRGEAVTAAATGVAHIVKAAHADRKVSGILGLGGSAGTLIATTAMRSLPLGVPKLMVSTLASGQVRPWVGDKDIFMLNSVVDIVGINRVTRLILTQAARAMIGLVASDDAKPHSSASPAAANPLLADRKPQTASVGPQGDKPLIAATMFGVTTPCVTRARETLEAAGYEVLVFHATGNGGQAMESLISEGLIAGVLDITTTELADELVGGILSAGPERLTAAGRRGIPQVISVGALDMVNFGPPETIPSRLRDRKFYRHNPTVTLMRTTVDENRQLGREIGRKAAATTGEAVIVLPLRGVSAIDCADQPFDDPAAREALFAGIDETKGGIAVVALDRHINDVEFADAAAKALLRLLARKVPGGLTGYNATGHE